MKLFSILIFVLLFLFCYSLRTNLKQRIALNYECTSIDGPKSPHEVCIEFDESKYS